MAGRPGSGEDESTPLFFLLAVLICLVVPWSLSILGALLRPGRDKVRQAFPAATEEGLRVRHCQTQAMSAKREAQIRHLTSRRENCSRGFAFRTLVLGGLWIWLIYIAVQLNRILATSSLYVDFNPYTLLEVARSAKKSDVKKAFHKMSLKYHPDKNPDPSAAEKFILVKKAFDALTDPVAKKNYEMYGNPDGPTRIELGMALPTFNKEHQGPVLMLFLLGFILGVPLTVLFCCMGDPDGDKLPNGILRSTMQEVAQKLTASSDLRACQALLLAAAENVTCKVREGEEEMLEKLSAEVRPKGMKSTQALSKAEVLFYVHTRRLHDQLSADLAEDLEAMLKKWRAVSMGIVEHAAASGFASVGLQALELYRGIVQAMEPGAATSSAVAALTQVPHLNADRIKEWRKGPRKSADLSQLVSMSAEDRKASFEAIGLDAQQVLDIDEFARVLPQMTITKAEVDVEGEDNICKDDIARVTVFLRRENVAEGEAAGSAHTPLFPSAAVAEAWWLSFALAGKIGRTRVIRVTNPAREFTVQIKFRVPSIGKTRYTVSMACEAYAGLDIQASFAFDAQRAEANRAGDDGSGEEGGGEDE